MADHVYEHTSIPNITAIWQHKKVSLRAKCVLSNVEGYDRKYCLKNAVTCGRHFDFATHTTHL